MEKIWIIGLGRFGLHAVRYLSKKNKHLQLVLVDSVEENLHQAQGPNRTLELDEGVAYLARNLKSSAGTDWIVPALPVHLAAEWCLTKLKNDGYCRSELQAEVKELLPNPMEGPTGDVYVSHADFKCPGDCVESRNICTVTQKTRKRNMFEVLADVKLPDCQSLVIRSHQLGPGIGGYRPQSLFDLLKRVKQAGRNFFISTACRCHGVVTGIHQIMQADSRKKRQNFNRM
jgi:hypothetical protein